MNIDELNDEKWAMLWQDLIWVRKKEAEESLKVITGINRKTR
jgi:hypothetical protein